MQDTNKYIKFIMFRSWLSIITPLVVLVALVKTSEPYKVLVVFPLPGKSHSILGDGYVRELLKKGHEVTYITPFPTKDVPANLTQIDVSFAMEYMPMHLLNVSQRLESKTKSAMQSQIPMLLESMMERTLTNEAVQNFLQNPRNKFDLIVLEWFFTELYVGLSALYQCPFVWSSSVEVNSLILRLVDEVPNPLLTQDMMATYSPPYSFLQRAEILYNMFFMLFMTESFSAQRENNYYKIYQPLFAKRNLQIPPYKDVLYNSSMILTNAHPSLGYAPKLPQNVKGVGGYHIELPTKVLPSNLQKILDEAKHGVIYFSLGSNIKSKDMPDKLKSDLLKMFGGFKQTVLWKFEEDLPNLPANVHIQKWMPQPSILAHPNLKIFITHGGLLSTTETVHYGVPIIGVPLFGDQFINMNRAVSKGFAISVDFTWNLADDLKSAVEEVLINPSYAATAKRLSSLYHDRPLPPAEELVYWLEYTVRTGGALHLRSDALLMPWYQRLYLDLIALIAVTLIGLTFLVKLVIVKVSSFNQRIKEKKNN